MSRVERGKRSPYSGGSGGMNWVRNKYCEVWANMSRHNIDLGDDTQLEAEMVAQNLADIDLERNETEESQRLRHQA